MFDENGVIRSALEVHDQFQQIDGFIARLRNIRKESYFEVQKIPFNDMREWGFVSNPSRFSHRSGKFFSIDGIRVKTNYGGVNAWDQPIINQPEIGILGFITKVVSGIRYFLMQAKMEPGNVNIVQLSPTVQATKSNFTQVHKGKVPLYLEYFLDKSKSRVLLDQLQPEQGARFFRKRNRNIIVEVIEELPVYESFYWLTLGELKLLMQQDNIVNMDSRSVLGCISYGRGSIGDVNSYIDGLLSQKAINESGSGILKSILVLSSLHSEDEILSWLSEMKTRYEMIVERIPLDEVRGWNISDDEIYHENRTHFSVVGVDVKTDIREVTGWSQPLVEHYGIGLIGFLTMEINGVMHFLTHASLEPGNIDSFLLGPTIACTDLETRSSDSASIEPFLEMFLNASNANILHDSAQSEEGGRFYQLQNRYMVVQPEEGDVAKIPENYLWMTIGQLVRFNKFGYLNIEARTLIACLSFFHGGVA